MGRSEVRPVRKRFYRPAVVRIASNCAGWQPAIVAARASQTAYTGAWLPSNCRVCALFSSGEVSCFASCCRGSRGPPPSRHVLGFSNLPRDTPALATSFGSMGTFRLLDAEISEGTQGTDCC
jgi:hypothetical protein